MRLKDISILSPRFAGRTSDDTVAFVPMESLREDAIDQKEISVAEGSSKYTYFADNDLLIAKVTPCFENGNIAVAKDLKGGFGFGSSEIFVLRFNKQTNPRYMFYLAESSPFQDKACATMCGVGGLKRISPLFMRTYEAEFPSLKEQDAIVAYLDKHINSINERICLRERELQTLNKLKQSEINSVVVRGLNTNVPMKDSGIPWIGVIPAHWEIKRMKDLFVESKSLSSTGQEDLLSVSEYYGVARRVDKMTEDEEYESRAESLIGYKLCRKNDLVINIMLAWKKGLGISDYEGIVSPAYAVYRSKHIVPHFYHYLLRSDAYIAEFKRNSKGIIDSRLRLYTERFYNISAVYPPIEEQQLIADYLDEKCQKIDEISENINRQIEKLKLLKKALINEIISGQRAIQ